MVTMTRSRLRDSKQTITISSFRAWLSLWTLLISGISIAQATQPLDPDGHKGTLIVIGGGSVPDEVSDALKQATQEGQIVILAEAASDPAAAAKSASLWLSKHQISDPVIVDHSLPHSERQTQTIAALESANAVWIGGGQQKQLAQAFAGSGIEIALQISSSVAEPLQGLLPARQSCQR